MYLFAALQGIGPGNAMMGVHYGLRPYSEVHPSEEAPTALGVPRLANARSFDAGS